MTRLKEALNGKVNGFWRSVVLGLMIAFLGLQTTLIVSTRTESGAEDTRMRAELGTLKGQFDEWQREASEERGAMRTDIREVKTILIEAQRGGRL